MKLRNAAPQWKHSWHSSYSRYWEIDDKRDNSRKAFRKAFRIAIWLWVLKRVSEEENIYSQGAIWYAFEPETRFCRDDKRKVVLKRLYNVSQKKTEPWNNGQTLWDVLLLSYLFHEVWLICFRMIHNWNSSNHASLSSIVLKIECQKPFVPLSGTCTMYRQGNCYNRSPMWPSLGFKPFSTKKQHGFIYMMILDNHLNNSLSFSSCVPSHHHWHKSTVALLNIVWFCARCSQKC